MPNKAKIRPPRYQQIAADIAQKITAGTYQVGDKIYSRSSLASQYGVSSETARRAICVLSDRQIVEVNKGSGAVIRSYQEALNFVKQFAEIESIADIKQNIQDSVQRQLNELDFFQSALSDLIDRTDRFRAVNPFTPFEIIITHQTPYLGMTVTEVNFWLHTNATIIAIRRNDKLLLSPGPYARFEENDLIYFIGEDDCLKRVECFLYPADLTQVTT